jgi:hypothetical protein
VQTSECIPSSLISCETNPSVLLPDASTSLGAVIVCRWCLLPADPAGAPAGPAVCISTLRMGALTVVDESGTCAASLDSESRAEKVSL